MEIKLTRNVVVDEIKKMIMATYAFVDSQPAFPDARSNETVVSFSFDVLGIPILITAILGSVEFRAHMTINGSIVNQVIDRYSRINTIINGYTIGFDDDTRKALIEYNKKDRILTYVVITGLSYILKNISFWLSRMLVNGIVKQTMIIDDSRVIDVDISEYHSSIDPLVNDVTDGLRFIDYIIIDDPNPPKWLIDDKKLVKAAFKAEFVRFKRSMGETHKIDDRKI